MKLLLVVDAQSPHAIHWIEYLAEAGHEVHLASTYPVDSTTLPVKSYECFPVDFSAKVRSGEKAANMGTAKSKRSHFFSKLRGSILWKALATLRNRLAPAMIKRKAHGLAEYIQKVNPDVVHAMRIPFEGLVTHAAVKIAKKPFVISTWGNDFTLFASRDPSIKTLTLDLLRDVNGLHSDCNKDVRIAHSWGLGDHIPTTVAPGNGGINAAVFHISHDPESLRKKHNLPVGVPLIINPRGLKEYVRNDTFFASIPLVLKKFPDAFFIALSMEGKAKAEEWVEKYDIGKSVRLLPSVSHAAMAEYFQASNLIISSSDHDGTPNSLLEGMACGCFPCAGDIESSHEWVTHGENGFIHDQNSPEALANDMIRAIEDEALRQSAREKNQNIIQERCTIPASVSKIEHLYQQVLELYK